ncbi:thiamine pyrophosphokinase [Actinopolyspora erythraea]|uniref:Thiamine pyrophosphokinase n=1 Tax=Actinopolyspora erythraea TaxID=414996 RepID=A0A099D6E1_9ACTN|nr:putative cytokinetic ring protein SteA [Actinopolyspora erythraea]ASU78554.1 thiamine pyrophosphokinase [Actinopolyspora erythraea]KGI81554.1 thiamine pyrophosphokinase [Actinopolyspora erythraea]
MRLSGLLGSRQEALPGLIGTARVQRRIGELPPRIGAREIVVLDEPDLDRRTAESLVAHEVAAVVNAAPSISGKYPNLGPEVLLAAGVVLVDDVGPEAPERIRDGATLRLYNGDVFLTGKRGEEFLLHGSEQDAESVSARMAEAKSAMSAQLEAFSANTIEFLRNERMLVLDGIGVPDVGVAMAGRHVLVVAPGRGHAEELRRLRRYIREYRPVLLGVGAAADTLHEAGLSPDVIVGDPAALDVRTLKAADEVVIPADTDGHAPGIERIQDLGIGAVTFPASGNPEDLALLLADAHDATLVATVGMRATLDEFLDRARAGTNPSTFLTRLRLGGKVVHGSAVLELQRNRVPTLAVLLLVLSVVLAMFAVVSTSGMFGSYLTVLGAFGDTVVEFCRGLIT